MRATGKYTVQLFNVTQYLEDSVEQQQNEIPFVLTRVAGRPEIYIHGCKWKWNNQERCPAVPTPVIDVQRRGESDI